MSPSAKKWVLGGAAVAVVAIVAAAFLVLRGGSAAQTQAATANPSDVVAGYVQAWSRGDTTTAGSLTDDPAAATAALNAARTGLAPTDFGATVLQVSGQSASARVAWTLGAGRVWTYDTALGLVRSGDGWVVHFTPAVIHPDLKIGERLAAHVVSGGNAVVDRDGKPLLTWQPSGAKAVDPAVAPLLLPAMARVAGDAAKGWSVVIVDAAGAERKLFGEGEVQAKSLTTSLSSATQSAAQKAVDGASVPAMLVAIQPSTGDLLAVAQNSAAGSQPGALSGLYAPGSTFKIATATAVLQAGVADANSLRPCPASVQLGQRTIPNDDGFSLGSLPLHSAFAHSCNTTFAQLASSLPEDALAKAASEYGLNADFTIPGITTEAGKVVAATSPAEQVESAIGQGTVQASPFGLALMSATVAAGNAITPKLWHGLDTKVSTGYQAPSSSVLTALRAMMREVVTSGTATGLAKSGQVYGKTGTAQFGDGSQANGWFTGYRGDVAFAVLLLGSQSSTPAVTTSATFLNALG
ncbi:penicillin-binding transpeptidase domain-containing protein [Amycolatopsis sp.]|uniref:penicillin-binding transpeptidase domain-containing protein n=1 Tax=Amycolatopsis sp. TaxID=37632 RepID=UPI002C50FA1E|nr:penicillin-binding transpeptidase domain-containing protein [Amycolatopsis sp.]HVV10368.1 penicillin-binding transpeptidase domain-containing protein [Amycolatopsis sp.]